MLDISNAWWWQYLDSNPLKKLLQTCRPVSQLKSILLVTDAAGDDLFGRLTWKYMGITFEHINKVIFKEKPDLAISQAFKDLFRKGELNPPGLLKILAKENSPSKGDSKSVLSCTLSLLKKISL